MTELREFHSDQAATANPAHAADNEKDRTTGERWERRFCYMAMEYGKVVLPHQLSRPHEPAAAYGRTRDGWKRYTLPDVTIFSEPSVHHEIKHKEMCRNGTYGWEQYRLNAAVWWAHTTGNKVYYTIHDWRLAGATHAHADTDNHIDHWVYADVEILARGRTFTSDCDSYYHSKTSTRKLPTDYWAADEYFQPLRELWEERL